MIVSLKCLSFLDVIASPALIPLRLSVRKSVCTLVRLYLRPSVQKFCNEILSVCKSLCMLDVSLSKSSSGLMNYAANVNLIDNPILTILLGQNCREWQKKAQSG